MTTSGTVLLYSATTISWGRHGEAIDRGASALRHHGEFHGLAVEHTEDPAVFESDLLDRCGTVVWLGACGDTLDEEQRARFETYLRSGGGFAGIHFASGGEPGWPLFDEIVGARFSGHPTKGAQRGAIRVLDRGHPSTAHLPDPWEWVEEWYAFSAAPAGRILLSVDTTSYDPEGTAMADPHPVCWTSTLGRGRTWYTSLGHHPGTYDDPLFRAHLWGGITSVFRES